MDITLAQLNQIIPLSTRNSLFVGPLNKYCQEFQINQAHRWAAFIAQIAVESGGFRWTRELGSDQYFDKYDIGSKAKELGNTPAPDHDGALYRGRGLIQITGRINYAACGKALEVDLIAHPELLEAPDLATRSACWYWQVHGLNALADIDQFQEITRRINGGLNQYADRLAFYQRAMRTLLTPV